MNREMIDHIKTIAVMSNLLYIMACDGKSTDTGRDERDRISDSLKEIERLLADEREKYLEILCASVCSFCADGEKFDLHGDKQGYWCHTEKGVSPTWQNQRCVAMSLREVNRHLDLAVPSDEGGEEKV